MATGWKYYNHALIPTTAPHEEVDINEMKRLMSSGGGQFPLMAVWSSDWDCGYPTEWWHVIKDTPFDINELKAKRRYVINKGKKNFDVMVINPELYVEEIYNVTVKAFSAYPEKYRPAITSKYKENILKWKDKTVFAGFNKFDGSMCGYALIDELDCYLNFSVLKTVPEYEKLEINAALVSSILDYYYEKIKNGNYITDGQRCILHETNFQDYLEKYFGFRKVYCKLNVYYHPVIKYIILLLYPFRTFINKFDYSFFHKISGILRMEKIRRKCDKL